MRVFISGGCKNGKSTLAQYMTKKLSGGGKLYYIATMIPHDDEDLARIARHIRERDGWGYETIECGSGISRYFKAHPEIDRKAVFLLDSVTAILSNAMFSENGEICEEAPAQVAEDLTELALMTEDIVFVSDYIYGDAELYDSFTESYRKGLAYVDRRLACLCDGVYECCNTRIITHKGPVPDPDALRSDIERTVQ